MEKVKTKAKSRATSLQKQKMDTTKDNIEEVVDEGVADDLNPEAPDQGVFASHLAQGGHHAHEIMPEFVEVPSLCCMGESRVAELKRRAEPFSRSTCETFSFCTSKTLSSEDTRQVLETFCNVSLTSIFDYPISNSVLCQIDIRIIIMIALAGRRSLNRKTFHSIRSGQWLHLSPTQ